MSASVTTDFCQLWSYEEAARLVARSWAHDEDGSLEYSADFIRSFLACPGTLPAVTAAVTVGGELAAFVCGAPRILRIGNVDGPFLLMTFFAVAPELQGHGLGIAVWGECLRRARAAGYIGALHYCVAGKRSNAVTTKAAEQARAVVRRVSTITNRVKLIRQTPASTLPPPQRLDQAVGIFRRAATAAGTGCRLRRIWTETEVRWALTREGAVWAMHEENGRAAVLAGYVARIAGRSNACTSQNEVLCIDEVLWDDPSGNTRSALLDQLMHRLPSSVGVASLHDLGQAEFATSVAKLGFRPSPRLVNAYLTTWDRQYCADVLENLNTNLTMYADVI